MRQINFKDQIFPHLIAIIIFLIVTILYFKPVFFEHKSLSQHDIQQWKGGAKELIDYRNSTDEEALWTNSMFSGMPGYLINVEWGNSIIGTIQTVISLGLPHPVRVVYLSFISFYILLLAFGVRPYLAIAGALAFGLSSYNIIGIGAGHNARIAAVAFMPLVLAGIRTVFKGKYLLGFTLTALAVALELRVGHLQITYYLFLMIAAYGVSELVVAFKNKELVPFFKQSGILVAAGILGLATFIGSVLSTMEYSKYSIRGKSELTQVESGENNNGLTKDYAFQYSNGIFEPMTMLIPNILGGSTSNLLINDPKSNTFKELQNLDQDPKKQITPYTRSYWGNQPSTMPYYAGAIIVFLFVLGIIILPKQQTLWLTIMIVFGIMLSWGSNFSSFNYLMFDYFPGYNKFRSVTFAIIIPILAMNLMGFIALEKFLQKEWNAKTKKQLGITFISTAGVTLLIWIFAGILGYKGVIDAQLPEWITSPLIKDRQALLRGSAIASFVVISLFVTTLFVSLTKKSKPSAIYLVLFLLTLVDLWSTDKKLNNIIFERSSKRSFFQKNEADQLILNDKTLDFRVFNLSNPWNEARTSYFHHSIGGYHGAKIRRYQDLIERGLSSEHQEAIALLRSGSANFSDLGVINMLNTRYLIAGPSEDAVIKNENANGNAWFVSSIESVSTADEELDKTLEIDTKEKAVIDQSKFTVNSSTLSTNGNITLIKYAPNLLNYTSENQQAGLAVFSEIYYEKGWVATIDGKEAPILRANYVLRALEIPAGKHDIEFSFNPSIYNWSNPIMLASSWLILLLILGTLAVELGFVKFKNE